MKKIYKIMIIFLIILNFITGFFTYRYFVIKPVIRIVEKTKIEYEIKYRDYDQINCCVELKKYDTIVPMLDGYIKKHDIFYVEAGLNDRTWNREFKLKVHESGNWNFYVAAGGVGAVVGATLIWKIMR